ncbi:StsB family radical SAM/SPASM domain sactipeptide maturase [Dactylosporangium sp. CA-092794]|uniref:StsB family radical SAM/SPASM domain sactipeptide maturase n=1 Tax=Dactylosporangium sp. CA-092794 TaxID=3239929 RepID=UPI003D943949
MKLIQAWPDLVAPADLVQFRCRDRYLVANPGLAAWTTFDEDGMAVLRALARGEAPPPLPAAAVERTLADLVLHWLVYLPGRVPQVRPPDPVLNVVYYAITDGCNLRCPYCYASSTRRLPGELTTAESIDLVDQVAALGAKTMVFTGGEAMLRKDLFDVAAHARGRGLRVNLITNGTRILDEAVARRVADTFDEVTVSLDGGTAETHEPTRGKGTFALTARALALLNDVGVVPSINHVVTSDNVPVVDRLAEFVSGLKVRRVRMMMHSEIGRGTHDNLGFTFDDYLALQRFTWTHPLAENLLTDGPKAAAKPCAIRGNCGLGGNEIYVNSLGDVYPCKLITDQPHRAGNVREQRLAEVFASPVLADLRGSSVFHGTNFSDCERCYIRGACGGGCRAFHAARSGDLKRNSRALCRVLRQSMVSSMWQASGYTGADLRDHQDDMMTPRLVRDGEIHPVYEDWRTEPSRLLPLLA